MFEAVLKHVSEKTPLVHYITNYVTVNDVANITLACGGSPIMADDIGEVEDFNFPPFNGRAVRIGIFLSVLNVHVNRTPAELEVESKYYREGEFLDARHPECAVRNEAMTIAGTAKAGDVRFPLAIRQISGKIARKIVCPVDPGRTLRRGEVYGMIKFGSRTELYLPVDRFDIKVGIGDKVRGGETVVAAIRQESAK